MCYTNDPAYTVYSVESESQIVYIGLYRTSVYKKLIYNRKDKKWYVPGCIIKIQANGTKQDALKIKAELIQKYHPIYNKQNVPGLKMTTFQRNPEYMKKYMREYYKKNREKMIATCKRCLERKKNNIKLEKFDKTRVLEPGYLENCMTKFSWRSIYIYVNMLPDELRSQVDQKVMKKLRELNTAYHKTLRNK